MEKKEKIVNTELELLEQMQSSPPVQVRARDMNPDTQGKSPRGSSAATAAMKQLRETNPEFDSKLNSNLRNNAGPRLEDGEESVGLRVRLTGTTLARWKAMDAIERGKVVEAGMATLPVN